MAYEEEDVIRLAPGEGLVIYSDGVSEAMNARQEQFTVARLSAALEPVCAQGSARTVIDGVMQAVRSFVGHYPQSDDITLLALRWQRPAAEGEPPATSG